MRRLVRQSRALRQFHQRFEHVKIERERGAPPFHGAALSPSRKGAHEPPRARRACGEGPLAKASAELGIRSLASHDVAPPTIPTKEIQRDVLPRGETRLHEGTSAKSDAGDRRAVLAGRETPASCRLGGRELGQRIPSGRRDSALVGRFWKPGAAFDRRAGILHRVP